MYGEFTPAFSCRALQQDATSERSERGAIRNGPVKSNALCGSFARSAADAVAGLERVWQMATFVYNGQHLDRVGTDSIEEAIRRHDQFPKRRVLEIEHHLADLWMRGGELEALVDPVHHPLRIHRRGQADVLDERLQMRDRPLRSTERERHEARRIRARTRARAVSWSTVRPASASASPCVIACRT